MRQVWVGLRKIIHGILEARNLRPPLCNLRGAVVLLQIFTERSQFGALGKEAAHEALEHRFLLQGSAATKSRIACTYRITCTESSTAE